MVQYLSPELKKLRQSLRCARQRRTLASMAAAEWDGVDEKKYTRYASRWYTEDSLVTKLEAMVAEEEERCGRLLQ